MDARTMIIEMHIFIILEFFRLILSYSTPINIPINDPKKVGIIKYRNDPMLK